MVRLEKHKLGEIFDVYQAFLQNNPFFASKFCLSLIREAVVNEEQELQNHQQSVMGLPLRKGSSSKGWCLD